MRVNEARAALKKWPQGFLARADSSFLPIYPLLVSDRCGLSFVDKRRRYRQAAKGWSRRRHTANQRRVAWVVALNCVIGVRTVARVQRRRLTGRVAL